MRLRNFDAASAKCKKLLEFKFDPKLFFDKHTSDKILHKVQDDCCDATVVLFEI